MRVINGRNVQCKGYFGSEFEKCRDHAINGKTTFYYEKLDGDALSDGNQHPGKHISHATKVYLKKLAGIWHIRAEIKLWKPKLKQIFPFLPRELERLVLACSKLNFFDFWECVELNYEAFSNKVLDLLNRKENISERTRKTLRAVLLIEDGKYRPAQTLKRHMVYIAKSSGLKHLADKISKYVQEMSLPDALFTPLSHERRFLLKFREVSLRLKEKAQQAQERRQEAENSMPSKEERIAAI